MIVLSFKTDAFDVEAGKMTRGPTMLRRVQTTPCGCSDSALVSSVTYAHPIEPMRRREGGGIGPGEQRCRSPPRRKETLGCEGAFNYEICKVHFWLSFEIGVARGGRLGLDCVALLGRRIGEGLLELVLQACTRPHASGWAPRPCRVTGNKMVGFKW